MVTPLSTAAAAALQATLYRRHGRHALSRPLVADKLHAFFVARGESINDLPLDVDVDDVDSWADAWKAMAVDAGVALESDRVRLIAWLHARGRPDSTARAAGGLANTALEALEAHGVTVSPDAIAGMQNAIAAREAGDEAAQCSSAVCRVCVPSLLGLPWG